jgi:hypothetical protein
MAGDDFAIGALALFGEPFDEAGRIGDLALCFGERLALFTAQQFAQRVLMDDHQIIELAKYLRAVPRRPGAPRRKGGFGGGNGTGSFGSAHIGNGRDDLAGRRVRYQEGVPAIGITPCAIDVALVADEICVAHGSDIPLDC